MVEVLSKTSVDEEPEEADLAIPSGVVAIHGEYSNSSIGAALFLLMSDNQCLLVQCVDLLD